MKSKEERLIEQAVLQAFEEDQKAYEQVEVSLPPDFKERILRLADASVEKKRYMPMRQRLILLAAVLLMLCCFTGMVAYPLISANIGHRKTEDGNGTHRHLSYQFGSDGFHRSPLYIGQAAGRLHGTLVPA